MVEEYVSKTGVSNSETIAGALSMMREASQLIRLVDAYFSSHNLSQLKFLILVVIDREPDIESLRQSEINRRLDVSKPVLNRSVSSLLETGLLKRIEDKEDFRAYKLALTEKGKSTLKMIMPEYFKIISKFMNKQI
ncbi:MAG: MarR family transcriptional regulator [Hyphomicrobiales bacterium]